MATIDVKKHLLDHSGIKVRLLGLYLSRYLAIISNAGYDERIRIYDLFCGEGLYENGGEGSPIVILRTLKELKESDVVKKALPLIDCLFNDIKKDKVEKAEKAAYEKGLINPENGKIKFANKDYQEEIKTLIEELPK